MPGLVLKLDTTGPVPSLISGKASSIFGAERTYFSDTALENAEYMEVELILFLKAMAESLVKNIYPAYGHDKRAVLEASKKATQLFASESPASNFARMQFIYELAIKALHLAYDNKDGQTLAALSQNGAKRLIATTEEEANKKQSYLRLALEALRTAAYFGSGKACQQLIEASDWGIFEFSAEDIQHLIRAQIFWYEQGKRHPELASAQTLPALLNLPQAWAAMRQDNALYLDVVRVAYVEISQDAIQELIVASENAAYPHVTLSSEEICSLVEQQLDRYGYSSLLELPKAWEAVHANKALYAKMLNVVYLNSGITTQTLITANETKTYIQLTHDEVLDLIQNQIARYEALVASGTSVAEALQHAPMRLLKQPKVVEAMRANPERAYDMLIAFQAVLATHLPNAEHIGTRAELAQYLEANPMKFKGCFEDRKAHEAITTAARTVEEDALISMRTVVQHAITSIYRKADLQVRVNRCRAHVDHLMAKVKDRKDTRLNAEIAEANSRLVKAEEMLKAFEGSKKVELKLNHVVAQKKLSELYAMHPKIEAKKKANKLAEEADQRAIADKRDRLIDIDSADLNANPNPEERVIYIGEGKTGLGSSIANVGDRTIGQLTSDPRSKFNDKLKKGDSKYMVRLAAAEMLYAGALTEATKKSIANEKEVEAQVAKLKAKQAEKGMETEGSYASRKAARNAELREFQEQKSRDAERRESELQALVAEEQRLREDFAVTNPFSKAIEFIFEKIAQDFAVYGVLTAQSKHDIAMLLLDDLMKIKSGTFMHVRQDLKGRDIMLDMSLPSVVAANSPAYLQMLSLAAEVFLVKKGQIYESRGDIEQGIDEFWSQLQDRLLDANGLVKQISDDDIIGLISKQPRLWMHKDKSIGSIKESEKQSMRELLGRYRQPHYKDSLSALIDGSMALALFVSVDQLLFADRKATHGEVIAHTDKASERLAKILARVPAADATIESMRLRRYIQMALVAMHHKDTLKLLRKGDRTNPLYQIFMDKLVDKTVVSALGEAFDVLTLMSERVSNALEDMADSAETNITAAQIKNGFRFLEYINEKFAQFKGGNEENEFFFLMVEGLFQRLNAEFNELCFANEQKKVSKDQEEVKKAQKAQAGIDELKTTVAKHLQVMLALRNGRDAVIAQAGEAAARRSSLTSLMEGRRASATESRASFISPVLEETSSASAATAAGASVMETAPSVVSREEQDAINIATTLSAMDVLGHEEFTRDVASVLQALPLAEPQAMFRRPRADSNLVDEARMEEPAASVVQPPPMSAVPAPQAALKPAASAVPPPPPRRPPAPAVQSQPSADTAPASAAPAVRPLPPPAPPRRPSALEGTSNVSATTAAGASLISMEEPSDVAVQSEPSTDTALASGARAVRPPPPPPPRSVQEAEEQLAAAIEAAGPGADERAITSEKVENWAQVMPPRQLARLSRAIKVASTRGLQPIAAPAPAGVPEDTHAVNTSAFNLITGGGIKLKSAHERANASQKPKIQSGGLLGLLAEKLSERRFGSRTDADDNDDLDNVWSSDDEEAQAPAKPASLFGAGSSALHTATNAVSDRSRSPSPTDKG